ncbi:MAG: DHH family phosphoesterase [Syntrophomonadaceae bacterium]|jgi:phosphoesterase RecJ-like protein
MRLKKGKRKTKQLVNSLEEIAAQLYQRDNFIITGHAIPDGDCIGSMIGLCIALQSVGKKAYMLLQDKVPAIYHYLYLADQVKQPDGLVGNGNVIFLDCSDRQRAGDKLLAALPPHSQTINIDHHETNDYFADYNYVNPHAAATAEIVYDLLEIMGITPNVEIANALYAGIIMDTGSFKYSNTTSHTFKVAAGLLNWGVDQSAARINLFESKSRKEVLLLSLALQTLGFDPDGKIAWMTLPYRETAALGALDLHPEGIINFTRMIKGVEVGLLFREVEPDVIKVGLRSKSHINVAELAGKFGGGGHQQAAGARIEGNLEEVKNIVINTVRDVIN